MGNILKHLLVVIILSPLLSRVCSADQTPPAPSQTVLTVQVTNGTANGSTVTGDAVTVQIYEHEQLLQSLEGEVDSNGEAVFENIPTVGHTIAIAGAKHQDMMFRGRAVKLGPGENKNFASVQVYDVSDDRSKLSVPTHHLIIEACSNTLQIIEYMQLKNSSDMAVISKQRDDQDRPVVLEIMLPAGFKNFASSSYFENDALVFTEQGFYDTMAVPPGEYSVNFSYTLDIDSPTMDIVRKISLPTSTFVLFADLGQAKLHGLGQPDKLAAANGAPMEYYKLNNLAPAQEIAFRITGFNVDTSGLSSWVVLAVVTGAVIILALSRLRPEKN